MWRSKKVRQVHWWVVTSVAGSVVALNYGVPESVIAAYWQGSGIAIAGAMLAFGLSDAAHAKK